MVDIYLYIYLVYVIATLYNPYSMNRCKVNWIYNQRTEAIRLLHTAANLSRGFYKINGFIVIPHTKETKFNGFRIVSLPDLNYLRIPGFWRKVKNFGDYNLRTLEYPMRKDIEQLMRDQMVTELDYTHREKKWGQIQDGFFRKFQELFPKIHIELDQIDIHPTTHGPAGSYQRIFNGHKKIRIFYRIDNEPWYIAKMIAMALTRPKVYGQYEGVWHDSQTIVDWMLNETELADILDVDSDKYIKWLCKKPTSYQIKQSINFRERLGIRNNGRLFRCDPEGSILYKEGKLVGLSAKQASLMKCLIRSSNRTVSYLDLWETVRCDEAEEFSLQSVNKNVERLRKKLEHNGATSSMIYTDRGTGYLLMN